MGHWWPYYNFIVKQSHQTWKLVTCVWWNVLLCDNVFDLLKKVAGVAGLIGSPLSHVEPYVVEMDAVAPNLHQLHLPIWSGIVRIPKAALSFTLQHVSLKSIALVLFSHRIKPEDSPLSDLFPCILTNLYWYRGLIHNEIMFC